jgi:hypothetical protein
MLKSRDMNIILKYLSGLENTHRPEPGMREGVFGFFKSPTPSLVKLLCFIPVWIKKQIFKCHVISSHKD